MKLPFDSVPRALKRKLPILKWLPAYSFGYLVNDAVAGVSVALTKVPQAIAYAVIAGLPPQYGLFSSFIPCFVYCVFGSVPDINVGPTALSALVIQPIVTELGADGAVLMTFIVGVLVSAMGLLQMGTKPTSPPKSEFVF